MSTLLRVVLSLAGATLAACAYSYIAHGMRNQAMFTLAVLYPVAVGFLIGEAFSRLEEPLEINASILDSRSKITREWISALAKANPEVRWLRHVDALTWAFVGGWVMWLWIFSYAVLV